MVKISWDGSGTFAGANDDVSAYVRPPFTTTRGRANVNDVVGTGHGQLHLANAGGRFSPYNTASPIYPNVLPARPILVQVTYNAVTYPVFKGKCTPEGMNTRDPAAAEVVFAMLDDYEGLRLGRTNTPLMSGQRVDQILGLILDDVLWSATARTLDVGTVQIGYFTNHNRLPLNALQLAEAQEPGSLLFMGRDGYVTWQNRNYRSLQTPYAVFSNTNFDSLDPQVRADDAISSVRAVWPRLVAGEQPEAVFQLQRAVQVPSGVSSLLVEVNVTGVLGASSYLNPVATTDYLANAISNGTGADKTAQVSMVVASSTAGDATLTVTNLDSLPAWIMPLTVRATALKAGGETQAYEAAVPSPAVASQQQNREFTFLDDSSLVRGWVDYTAKASGGLRPRPVMRITPSNDALMATVLGADLSKRITIADNTSAWQTGVNGDFYIENISVEWRSTKLLTATWTLFDADRANGRFFRISGTLGGGLDYSTISAASPAAVLDRIAF